MKNIFLIGIVAGLAAALALAGLFSTLSTQSAAQMMHNPSMMGQGMMGTTTTTQGTQSPWQWNNRAGFSASGVSYVNSVQITGISIIGDNELTVNLRSDGSGVAPSVTVIASTNPTYMMGRMHASMGITGSYYGMEPGMMYDYGYPGMMGYGSGLQDGSQMQSLHGQMMGGSYGGMGPGMMYGYNYSPATTANFNSTQWKDWNEQMIQWHNQMIELNGSLNSTEWAQMQEMHNQMMTQAPASMMALMHGGAWNGTATTVFPASYFQYQIGSSVLDSGWSSTTALKVKLDGDGSAYDSGNVMVMVYPLTS